MTPFLHPDEGQHFGGLTRQPSRLVGNRFQALSEYPRFSWQEALLNAIAHRDYSLQGNGIEVWLFDDRMEVLSPGGLLPEFNLQELLSRNTRLMRTLVDLGLTRDQGEGIPRMFAEMENASLPAPRIEPTARNVTVVLGNTTTLTEAAPSWSAWPPKNSTRRSSAPCSKPTATRRWTTPASGS